MSPRKKTNFPSGIAVIYARYSSHNQREASIEQQVEQAKDYAARNHLKVIDIYSDKAISGKTDCRPAFQKMMRDASQGLFQFVIAWKSNRMGRNMLQAMVNESKLADYGVRCLYVEEDFDDTAAGRFALRNMMNVNQFYSENMAEDIRRGLMDNARRCLVNNGGLPLGYKKGDDGRYAIDDRTAPIVKEIFERVLAGDTYTEIANDLNARGIKTSKGAKFNKGSFRVLISNERYIGVYEYGDVRIEGGVPPIISKELFYAVQKRIKTKGNPVGRPRENSEYLLTGKLFCGHCGSPMVGLSGTSMTGDKHYYYVCQKKRLEKSCEKKNVRREWIEQQVINAVHANILREDVIEWIAAGYGKFVSTLRKDSALQSAQDAFDSTNRSIKNLMTAIEQGIITPTTKDRLMELEQEKHDLEIEVSILQAANEDITPEQIQFWMESFRNGSINDKKYQTRLIDLFVKAVYLYDDSIRIVGNYCGTKNSVTVTFDEVDSIGDEGASLSSYTLSSSPPEETYTNYSTIYLLEHSFVLVIHY